MQQGYYSAKEGAEILKKSIPTVYRKAKSGDLPSIGKRPNIQFPKRAIDAIAKVGMREEEGGKLTYTPATLDDSWTKQELNHPYADEDSVPFETVLEWRKKNYDVGMNVKEGSKLVGWVTFLPIEENTIIKLINNKIKEKDIMGDDIRKWNERNLSVYIPIIEIIPSDNTEKDKRRGMYLIRSAIKWGLLLSVQYDIRKWYAIGVNAEGQAILEALGFKTIAEFDEGKRKSYVLDMKAEPVKLVSHFAESQKEARLPSLRPRKKSVESVQIDGSTE